MELQGLSCGPFALSSSLETSTTTLIITRYLGYTRGILQTWELEKYMQAKYPNLFREPME